MSHALLDMIARGLETTTGHEQPMSPEVTAYCGDIIRRAKERDPDGWTPEELKECARDLVAHVLTFQDQGYSAEDAIDAAVDGWVNEWGLT